MRLAVLINPIAGMGGSVGLKGTDGDDVIREAVHRGARPLAEDRMRTALASAGDLTQAEIITCGGPMGENALSSLSVGHEVVHIAPDDPSAKDTLQACGRFLDRKAELLLFAGGDGTARDVLDAIGTSIPVIGVPSGVKMHSAVFANSARDAGALLSSHLRTKLQLREAEVMDIDEEAYRQGRLSVKLYGYLLMPYDRRLVQPIKGEVEGLSVEEEKEEIAEYFVEKLDPSVLYVLGPGTTLAAVAQRIGLEKTLLGVDLIQNGRMLAKDVTETDILRMLDGYPQTKIVVTPIGSQGFILGRGNQQISPAVIKMTGQANLIVLSAPSKLATIRTLRVDTGDLQLDISLRGHRKVLVGRGRWKMMRVE